MSIPARLVRSSEIGGRLPVSPVSNHSRHLFDKLPHRDLQSFNSTLSTHLKNGDPLSTWDLFRRIHSSSMDLNEYTFTPLLGACSVLPSSFLGKQAHTLMVKLGLNSQIIPQTALMNMYSKHGSMVESCRVFDEMDCKDVVTWNALISNYLRHEMAEKAILAVEEMQRNGIGFTAFTLSSVLKACEAVNALRQGKQVHALIITMETDDMVFLSSSLINFYSHFNMIDRVIQIYETLGCDNDRVMNNSYVSACVKNKRYDKAMVILTTMKPNTVALTSALSACSETSDLPVGKQIHCVALRFSLINDTRFCNSLLDMYAKSGEISLARLVFDRMPLKNVVSWTTMIDGYGANGDGATAVELFNKMEEDFKPNDVTFLAVLSACSRAGLVDQGRQCFNSIQKKYNFIPGSKHYACYIDLLGRAGHIEEIWCVYEEMVKNGIKPNSEVWAALMNACGQNNDISRGEFAARKLRESQPDKPGTYLLVSNFYATIGKWDTADQHRSEMKGKGLVKNVGISWVSASRIEPKSDAPTQEPSLNLQLVDQLEKCL